MSAYVSRATEAGLGESVVVAGSFVSSVQEPNDIDVLLELASTHEMSGRLRPHQYNVVARSRAGKMSSIDLFAAPIESLRHVEFIEFFQLVRDRRDVRRGILRVKL